MGKKTKQDPTGQARSRNQGTRALRSRLRNSEKVIKKLFREIPRQSTRETKIVNAQEVVYEYQLSPREQELFATGVQATLNEQLLESQGEMPPDWYWKNNVELPYRQGTLEEANRFNQLIAGTVAAGAVLETFVTEITPEQVLASREYRQAVQNVYASNYQTIKTLSETTSSQVIRVVNDGISAGETPSEIAKKITERFDVADSSAERIARTEVNKAYTNSKLNAVSLIAKRTGLRAGVIHISALTTTTRQAHAARHGNAYTVTDQEQWWNTGANRINCLCSVISVLIDDEGKVVQSQTQKEIKAERKFFE